MSFTAHVAARYMTMILNSAIWLDAQAGLSYLFMPLVPLLVGGISSVCGAVSGGLVARLVPR